MNPIQTTWMRVYAKQVQAVDIKASVDTIFGKSETSLICHPSGCRVILKNTMLIYMNNQWNDSRIVWNNMGGRKVCLSYKWLSKWKWSVVSGYMFAMRNDRNAISRSDIVADKDWFWLNVDKLVKCEISRVCMHREIGYAYQRIVLIYSLDLLL